MYRFVLPFTVLICVLCVVIDLGSPALETTYDPRIPSAMGSSDRIPSMGSPDSVLSIDSVHDSLSVRFIDWRHAWQPLRIGSLISPTHGSRSKLVWFFDWPRERGQCLKWVL